VDEESFFLNQCDRLRSKNLKNYGRANKIVNKWIQGDCCLYSYVWICDEMSH